MFAINGFGRIGRCIFRAYFEENYPQDLELAMVNCGVGTMQESLHFLKYDSIHGKFPSDVKILDDSTVEIEGKKIKFIFQTNPEKINWKEFGVETVLEATGKFTSRTLSELHIKSGAKNVIISAPAKDEVDATIVYGVNHSKIKELDDGPKIISAGSCTTNCLAPVLKGLLDGGVQIDTGFMTTIHAYTNDQNLIDSSHKDLRRARAAATSMIPSSTGAAKAIGLVLPQMKGRLDGVAVRVPVPNVSMVDLALNLKEPSDEKSINNIMRRAASSMPRVLRCEEGQLVSVDFNHDSHSSIFDTTQTRVIGDGKMIRVVAWYDNEWGFSNRMLDILDEIS